MKSKHPRIARGNSLIYLLASIGVIAVAVIGGIAVRSWLPADNAAASGPVQIVGDGNQVLDQTAFDPLQSNSVVANGVEVSISNVQYVGSRLRVDVCFSLPDGADWTLEGSYVSFGGPVVMWSETNPISLSRVMPDGTLQLITFAADGSKSVATQPNSSLVQGQRCDTVFFDGIPAKLGPAELTIPAIVAEPREGEECSATNLAKYQIVVSSRFPGVKAVCSTGTDAAGIEVKSVPPGVSTADVSALVSSEDFLVNVYGLRGPWSFQIDAP